MGSVVMTKNTIKSLFFATNNPENARDGPKQKIIHRGGD